ncbi:hypothetical protein ACFL06_00945 [Patescibacteria group bacterium]
MQQVVITPQVFFDLFMLCFSWQWREDDPGRAYTTVDKIARILHGLGIITERQRARLHRDLRAQNLFLKHAEILPLHITASIKIGKRKRETWGQAVLRASSFLVINKEPGKPINRKRLLRDLRFYLTGAGKQYADSIAEKYAPIVTKEAYFEEDKRQQENWDSKRAAGVMKKYRQKLQREEEDE